MPGTKRPGFLFAGMWIGLANWQKRFNGGLPPATERERWAAGDAGVGVVAGEASHGLIAVDIDSEDPAIQAALQTVLPPTHVRKTGARGETLFHYGPEIAQSQSWNIAGKRVVDLWKACVQESWRDRSLLSPIRPPFEFEQRWLILHHPVQQLCPERSLWAQT